MTIPGTTWIGRTRENIQVQKQKNANACGTFARNPGAPFMLRGEKSISCHFFSRGGSVEIAALLQISRNALAIMVPARREFWANKFHLLSAAIFFKLVWAYHQCLCHSQPPMARIDSKSLRVTRVASWKGSKHIRHETSGHALWRLLRSIHRGRGPLPLVQDYCHWYSGLVPPASN